MIGHRQVIEYRRRRKKPTYITIRYGCELEKIWNEDEPEKRIRNGFPPVVYIAEGEMPDMRFLTGCNVLFEAEKTTESGNRLVKKILQQEPKQLIYATTSRDFAIWRGGKWAF